MKENTNKKDFGYTDFPKSTKNSGRMAPRPSPVFPTGGKPKAEVNAGGKFPKTIRPGTDSQYK